MYVVPERMDPPVGPGRPPTAWSRNQGIAPGATNAESLDSAIFFAHTALVSSELCQVARAGVPASAGLGLRKWVAICWRTSPVTQCNVTNRVACGPWNFQ